VTVESAARTRWENKKTAKSSRQQKRLAARELGPTVRNVLVWSLGLVVAAFAVPISCSSGPKSSQHAACQRVRLTFSARINVSEISISETVGRNSTDFERRTRPEGNRLIVGPLGVQGRSGLGARVPFRWPRPETGKISLVRFPRNVQLSPSLLKQTPSSPKGSEGAHSGQLMRLRKVGRTCTLGAPGHADPLSIVSRGTT
jgi:hypothetical protein